MVPTASEYYNDVNSLTPTPIKCTLAEARDIMKEVQKKPTGNIRHILTDLKTGNQIHFVNL